MTMRHAAGLPAVLLLILGCSDDPGSTDFGAGGVAASGGQSATSGGASTTGGSNAAGGTATGGSSTASGGSASSGGSGTVPFTPPECAEGSSSALPGTAPTLSVDQFTNISPPGVPFDSNATSITQGMTMDPCNPSTIYVCVGDAQAGIYRSTDGGGNWTRLEYGGGFPVRVRVDPADPLHLYVGDGVRGGQNGFFLSTDGGQNWTIPQGFIDFAQNGGTYDVYHVEPDPTDFDHVLVTFHSPWKDAGENGVIESFDGGLTWRRAGLVGAGATQGADVYMLYEPSLGIGNPETWLFASQGNGHWRTTDSGDSWTRVEDTSMQHGGGSKYYTKDGTLYISSAHGILRSTDNGVSFTNVGPENQGFLSVIGDGTQLYAAHHFNSRYQTAPESNDTQWNFFNDQQFDEGAFEMVIDHENGILYAAQIRAGVYALKLD